MRKLLGDNRIIGIMRNIPSDRAARFAETLSAAGVGLLEVTLNTEGALSQIEAVKKAAGETSRIGAGTVLSVNAARDALSAGAEFLITPCVVLPVMEFCASNGVPLLPGAATPSEVFTCLEYGFDLIKLFPAGCFPLSYAKALKGPFADADFVAVNGVSYKNGHEFIENGYTAVACGSAVCDKELISSGDFDGIFRQVSGFCGRLRSVKGSVGQAL